MGQGVESALRAVRAGRYKEAARFLEALQPKSTASAVLSLEVAYYLGDTNRLRIDGRRLLDSPLLTPSERAECALVNARLLCDEGGFDESLALCYRAAALAEESKRHDVAALAAAYLLERNHAHHAFEAARSQAAQTRRLAARCGDSQVRATVHATFGRLEARAGHFETALRHIGVARTLLEPDPNLRIIAAVSVDEASVRSLCGDLRSAIALTTVAFDLARESGWSKGIVMSAGNLAHFLAEKGDVDGAVRFLTTAAAESDTYESYEWPLAQTRAQIALQTGDYDLAERLLTDYQPTRLGTATAKWYGLSGELVKARLFVQRGQWDAAIKCCEASQVEAVNLGAQALARTFIFCRADALASGGDTTAALEVLMASARSGWPPGVLAEFWLVLAKCCRGIDETFAARNALRAARVFEAAGAKVAAQSARIIAESSSPQSPTGLQMVSDLEALEPLFEVAEQRQILASEAFALLKETACVRRAAVASSVSGNHTQIHECCGCTEEQALIGLQDAAGFETIHLGQDRERSWLLLAEPIHDLRHRSTYSALRTLIGAAISLDDYRRLEKQRAALWPVETLVDSDSIWASEQMSEVLDLARRVAPGPLTVLLTGETGTGKEVLARDIHRASGRGDRIFLPFNCTAVPRDMLDSQLFGYRKGAFTGADASFPGVIRSAEGGTLFLDEIADIPLELQPKLLRFLETHEIHPLGEGQPVQVDVRIVAATNASIEQLVAEGRFRADLFYRLNIVRLKLPPLRHRREEIPALVHHYLRKFGDEQKKGQLTLADETLEYLLLFAWPGNVRQLANEVRRMVALAEPDAVLTPALLSPEIQASRRTIPATAPPAGEPELRLRLDQPLPLAVEILEQAMIRSALQRSRGRVEEAAKLLGISRKGLFLKRRRWNLDQQQAS